MSSSEVSCYRFGMMKAGRRMRVMSSTEEPSSVRIIAGIRELVNRGGTAPLGRGWVIAGSNPASGVLFPGCRI